MNPEKMNTGKTAEQAFDDAMEDLEYLERAQANDPESVKIKRYAELTKRIAESIVASVGENDDEKREASQRLGAAARVISGSQITSDDFAQSGTEPAVPNTVRRVSSDGMVLLDGEKPSATTWKDNEQNQ